MQVEAKYNRGAKIILFISIIAIPMQLITSALISRVSSEASGILGILEIFYNAMITFFMLGGETAIIKILAGKQEIENKKSFILKYILGCILIFLVITIGLRIFNIDIIQNITGQTNPTSILMYFVGLLVIVNNILLSYVKESEKFINYAIGIKLFNLGNLLAVLYVFFIAKDSNIENVLLICMGLLQLINIIYIFTKEKIFSKLSIEKQKIFDKQMLGYVLFLYLSMILVFVYDKIDQIIVVNKLGLSILGGYYLTVKIVNMVKLLPNTYNSTFYPYICKMLSKDNSNSIFNNILSKNLLFIFPLTLIIVLNYKMIINILFGNQYLQYGLILQILTSIILFSAPTAILNNFLYAIGKSRKYFVISFVSVIIQVILICTLINKIGLLIVAIARGCSTMLVLVLCKISLNKMGYKTRLPLNYYWYCVIIIISLIITNLYQINDYIYIVISILILSIFAIKNRQGIISLFKKGNTNENI